jgi:hypothetical protein
MVLQSVGEANKIEDKSIEYLDKNKGTDLDSLEDCF